MRSRISGTSDAQSTYAASDDGQSSESTAPSRQSRRAANSILSGLESHHSSMAGSMDTESVRFPGTSPRSRQSRVDSRHSVTQPASEIGSGTGRSGSSLSTQADIASDLGLSSHASDLRSQQNSRRSSVRSHGTSLAYAGSLTDSYRSSRTTSERSVGDTALAGRRPDRSAGQRSTGSGRSVESAVSVAQRVVSGQSKAVVDSLWESLDSSLSLQSGRTIAEASRQPRRAKDSDAGSSSAATRRYSLVGRPPVVELSRSSFDRRAKAFHGDEIQDIAANPQQYSSYVSSKAGRTASVAEQYGTTRFDSKNARYFSYQLGKKSAGLLRTEGGFDMGDVFEGDRWRERFPGRTDVTSTVDLRISHPLIENVGDILLEHQLRIDGDRPLLNSSPANPEARARAGAMGFVEVDGSNMVLDPTQHPDKWTRNSDGEWQRANKPKRYLARAEGSSSESGESAKTGSSDGDFM